MCCLTALCCCGKTNEIVAQLLYTGILVIASILAIILKYFGGKAFVNFYAFQFGCSTDQSSDDHYYLPCAGDQAVYRISFGLVIFFLGMMPLGVISKACHTGFWIIKIPLAIVCIVFPFFIPNEFFNVYFKVAYPFAAFYLIVQMLVIVGFAYDMHSCLVKKMDNHDEAAEEAAEEEEKSCQCCNIWKGCYLGACIVIIIAIVAAIIFMYARFSCALPYTMISIAIAIVVVLIILSILEKVGQGLLVGMVIAAYATYLTWSALSSYPNPQKEMWKLVDGKNESYWVDEETCNPFLCDPTNEQASCGVWVMIFGICFSALSVGWTGWRVGLSSTRVFKDEDEDEDKDDQDEDSSLMSKKKKKKKYGSQSKTEKDQDKLEKVLAGEADATDEADLEDDDFDEHDDEDQKSKKCCGCKEQAGRLFFYVVMDLACWYLAMLLTNWSNSQNDQTHGQQIGVGYTSTFVQFGAQWFMLLLYLWTLCAPHFCTCRDYSDED